MSQTTLDGSATPFVIASGSTELANDGEAFVVLGSIDNLGTISLNGTGTYTGVPTPADIAYLMLASPTVTLGGGGTLLLANQSDSFVFGNSATTQTLDNSGDTIIGSGVIGVGGAGTLAPGVTVEPIVLVNGAGGVIDANGTQPLSNQGPVSSLILETVLPIINDGLLEATGVGGLYIAAGTVDQSGGGTILASGANVEVDATIVIGGTLQTTGGGQIILTALDGLTAAVTIAAGTALVPNSLAGTIDNQGTLLSSSVSVGGLNIVLASPTVTLRGGGMVDMVANVNKTWGRVAGTDGASHTLVNVDNTIAGFGFLGVPAANNSGTSEPVALTNDSAGVVDATGSINGGDTLILSGGGSTLRNAGLLEATGYGTLFLSGATIDNTGGTILASDSGDVVSLNTVSVSGGQLGATGGGVVVFASGSNTLSASGGVVSIAAGDVLTLDAGVGLTLAAATLNTLGTFLVGGAVVLTSPTLMLTGSGNLQLNEPSAYGIESSIAGIAGETLVNVDSTISGGGEISDGALAVTNDPAGVIDGADLDASVPMLNRGVLTNVSVGLNLPTTIDNAGATLLADAGVVGLYNADIVGGTLAASNGGQFDDGEQYAAGGNATLDGRGGAVTIAAGATLVAWVTVISDPFYLDEPQNLTLLGTVDLLGSISALNTDSFGGGGTFNNEGVLVPGPAGSIAGTLTNTGVIEVPGGTFTVSGAVNGLGSIDIAAGATFELGGTSTNTIDFGGNPNATLAMLAPTHLVYVNYGYVPEANFTGTLANLTMGDTLDFVAARLASADVAGGNTLAVVLTSGATLDYALANLAAGTKVALGSSTPTTTEIFDFSYTATTGTAEPDSTTSGSGSITVTTGDGTADLASVTAFTLDLAVSTTDGVGGLSGTDQLTYDLANLVSFAATFGTSDTLTSLSLDADYGGGSSFYSQPQTFEVINLGTAGAETQNSYVGLISQGSIDVTPVGQLLSDVVIACFAAGTHIATACGEVAVEDLQIGDEVRTAGGRPAPVRWLGHRHVDCRRHPRPHDVTPVRIRPGAFGDGLPHAALLLSPDHAVFVDGALIPVRLLIDGHAIEQRPVEHATYWHVELDRHDVILAEGLPCESFLDTGTRAAFANGGTAVQLQPDFARQVWDGDACAPLVIGGPALVAARARLRDRVVATATDRRTGRG